MSGNEHIEVCVDYLHHTDHAVLVRDGDGSEHWLPLVTVNTDDLPHGLNSLDRGQAVTLGVQEWIAQREGLI